MNPTGYARCNVDARVVEADLACVPLACRSVSAVRMTPTVPPQVDVKPDWLHLNGESTEDFTMSLPQMEKLKAEDEPRARTLGAFVCTCRRLQARASHACSKPSR